MTNVDQGPMGPAELLALAQRRSDAMVAAAEDDRHKALTTAKAAGEVRVAVATAKAEAARAAAETNASTRREEAQNAVDQAQAVIDEMAQRRSSGDIAELTARANDAFSRVKVATSLMRGAKEPVIMAVPEDVYDEVAANMSSEPDPYRLVHLNAYDHNGLVLINTLWVERGEDDVEAVPEWHAFYGLSAEEYQARYEELVGEQGLAISQIHTYVRDGEIRYAPVFTTDTTDYEWTADDDLALSAAQERLDELVAEGYRPVTRSVDYLDGEGWVTALYDQADVGSWASCLAVDADEFQQWCTGQEADSLGMTSLDVTVDPDGVPRFSAVWDEASYRSDSVVHQDLDETGYHEEYTRLAEQGHVVSLIATYEVDGKLRYAAVFTRPE